MVYGIIYKIENLLDGKIYVGQTINHLERERFHFYSLKGKYHHNEHLQNAYNKNGRENFKYTILSWAKSKEELDYQEKYFISKYNTLNRKNGYNFKNGGGNGAPHQETREKISKLAKERFKDPKNNPMYGKCGMKNPMYKVPRSFETRKKLSNNNGNKPWHGLQGAKYNKCKDPFAHAWESRITYNKKQTSLGYFIDPLSASIVYKFTREEIYNE